VLTENDVVESVKRALEARHWSIVSFSSTAQTGIDIHASRNGMNLYIEAKGITSSKDASSRFGKVQTGSQMFISVAAALLKTSELRTSEPTAAIAIALPDHPRMSDRINRIAAVLKAAGIGVLWVASDGTVSGWNAPWFVYNA